MYLKRESTIVVKMSVIAVKGRQFPKSIYEAMANFKLKNLSHLDILDRSKRSKQLPKDVLLRFWSQVVDKDTPSGSIGGHAWQQGVSSQKITSKRGKPTKTTLQLVRYYYHIHSLKIFVNISII